MYSYYCIKCDIYFSTKKKNQQYCSKSCANSVNTSKRKIEDESIFENGLNNTSAYILGLIYSDGCISFDKHTNKFRITIALNDYDLIESIHNIMTPNKKIYQYKHKLGTDISYSVVSTCKADIDYLKKIGVHERKSLNIRYPNINKDYDWHFLRGYFDGSVYQSKTNTYYNGVKKSYIYTFIRFTTGSKEFAEDIVIILRKYGINATLNEDSRDTNKANYVCIYKRKDVLEFYKLLYKDATLFMKRKKYKFINMI